jgi:prevent-host-death family protein
MFMRTMPAGEFKAKCLALMDEVQAKGQTVIVTKRGKPVARLCPLEEPSGGKRSMFGRLRHLGVIHGDIVSSEFSDAEWERMADEKWARTEKGASE